MRSANAAFAAGLLFFACVNGLAPRAIEAALSHGWAEAALSGFNVGMVEALAVVVGCVLVSEASLAPAPFLILPAAVLVAAAPQAGVAWVVAGLLATVLIIQSPPGGSRRGAVLVAVLAAHEIWASFGAAALATPILSMEAHTTAAALSFLGKTTTAEANIVSGADGARYIILLGCSAAPNLSLALVILSGAAALRPESAVIRVIAFTIPALAAVVAANGVRLVAICWSPEFHQRFHSPDGGAVYDALLTGLLLALAWFATQKGGARCQDA